MDFSTVEQIEKTLLYEGYLLYPYRRSSLKNSKLWTPGGLCPRDYSELNGSIEPWSFQCEVIVLGSDESRVEVAARFLQLLAPSGSASAAASSSPFGPALERTVTCPSQRLEGKHSYSQYFCLHRAELDGENVQGVNDNLIEVASLAGCLELSFARVGSGTYKLAIQLQNLSRDRRATSDSLPLKSFHSPHVVLSIDNGEFVSQQDPPGRLKKLTDSCRNVGAWPVMMGSERSRNMMLCSPTILYDFPAVAPESHGDLFDGTEINELLCLRILTLSEEERREIARSDADADALLRRTETLTSSHLANLHGAIRSKRKNLGPGDKVRLRPSRRADIFDLALTDREATIVSVEEDFESRRYYAVTIDADPGSDLGVEGKAGHRFFFRDDEVEPLSGGLTTNARR